MGANIGEKGAETKVGERNNRLRRLGTARARRGRSGL